MSFRKKNEAGTGYGLSAKIAFLMWWWVSVDWGSMPQCEDIWGECVSGRRNGKCRDPEVRCMSAAKGPAGLEWSEQGGCWKIRVQRGSRGPDHIASLGDMLKSPDCSEWGEKVPEVLSREMTCPDLWFKSFWLLREEEYTLGEHRRICGARLGGYRQSIDQDL